MEQTNFSHSYTLRPEMTILEKEIKEYDFVNYHDLIIGTLYDSRFEGLCNKFKVDKILNVFVKRMKEQIAALPKSCELRKIMADKIAGCKTFTLSNNCDKTKALKTLTRLAEIGLFEFSNNNLWISRTPNKKLSDKCKRIIYKVENLYVMDVNNLRSMICDCVEDIIDSENDCMIIRKEKLDPKVESILNNFDEFYKGVKSIDKYLKPKKKKADSKDYYTYSHIKEDNLDNQESNLDENNNEDEAY